MDSSKKYVQISPEEKAGVLSKLFYWWFLPFFKFGYKNEIKMEHVYNTTKDDLSGPLGDELQKNWEEELKQYYAKRKKKPSLKNAIFKTFWQSYSPSGAALFFSFVVIRMLHPIVLAKFVNFFDSQDEPRWGWIWGTVVIAMASLNIILFQSSNLSQLRVGMRVRTAVCSLIYRKLLKLNHKSLGETAVGQLVNLLSNDVQRFDMACPWLHYLWIMPIGTAVSFYILYCYVGLIAAVAGMVFMSLQSVPLQGSFSKWQGKLRYKIAIKTDYRIKLMSEITSGIQVIKMYAWEKPFEKVVELAREYEVNVIKTTSYCNGVLSAMSIYTERMVLYITVLTFVFVGNRITGDVVFCLAQLFNAVQLIMSICFPRALSLYSETLVSINRLEDFLMLEENEELNTRNEVIADSNKIGEIKLSGVSASWTPKSIVPTLIDINMYIEPGTLCCVVGHVGCGKTSLLQLLLKELPITMGKMSVTGKIAYVSQEPWLFVSNVQQNILFGKPFIQSKYQDVVKVCSLERDFKQFPFGDKTEVGERGTSLSGGQRARVNLARAVYTDADIYLLDDPLSAVDTKVGRHLFDECITKYLNGKTRILVTHQLQFMKKADVIIMINNGKIEKVSQFDELTENELNSLRQESETDDREKEKIPDNPEDQIKKVPKISTKENFESSSSLGSYTRVEEPAETDELMEKGAISNSTYYEYWRSGGGIILLLFMFGMFILGQAVTNASDLWLTHWVNVETKKYAAYRRSNDTIINSTVEHTLNLIGMMNETTTISILPTTTNLLTNRSQVNEITKLPLLATEHLIDHVRISPISSLTNLENIYTQEYYIWVYSALIFISAILLTWRSFLYYHVCMTASKVLHNKMFSNILQAPMRFFDTNPSGRILNRFSKDVGAVDEVLPRCQMDTIQILCVMFGILAMVFIVSPWMIIPTLILAPLYIYFRKVYLTSSQAIKRLEGSTKAPIFSHLAASVYGITTIRAADAQKLITREFDSLQDQHTSTYFLFLASSAAFGFYLDVISLLYVALVTYQFVIFRNENTLSASVGLVISHSLILTGMVQLGVRQSAEVASNMVSVERMLQYTKLEKEGPFESLPTKKPRRDWPDKGKITFKNAYLRYAPDSAPVLKDIDIEISSGEKIGIVGRTGAGKSSLIASLFRLAPIDGTIAIDGIDTGEIGLNDLRSNISIIPQEPILFSASVRYNLDPFEKHSDEVLWKALDNVKLKGVVIDLSQPLSEGGSNFSTGQRQLICLARAIVRNNKVLVMDEATANVDPQTDALIQQTIRERFADCTVLTVAHRLNTIMDSDRVLVMDAGQAMEFDHPHILLKNPEGYFSKMVLQTGPSMQITLESIARDSYNKKVTKDISGNQEVETS